MCGFSGFGICRLNELTSAQFGFTRQLVFRIALPHISLLLAGVGYVIVGSWILTTFRYIDDNTIENNNSLAKLLYEDEDSTLKMVWNLFFVTTALTSIGYGNNVPDSVLARIFLIFYISFGIPLFLITLADLAKFCTEFINRLYAELLKYKFAMSRKFQNTCEVPVNNIIIAGGEDEVAEFLWTHLENTHFVEVPFTVVYFLLVLYIIIASYLISQIEGWSICDGFYFVVISVLTIGFGDFVPQNQSFMLLTLFILLFGLILTTTFIDVVGAYYIDRLHFFGRNLDTENPLDWLKAVQQQRINKMKREAMRKLFETVTALQHMQFNFQQLEQNEAQLGNVLSINAPDPPRNLRAFSSRADSVTLLWDPPSQDNEEKRFWYTITYRKRTPQGDNNPVTFIEFINKEEYVVTGLQSFTLYSFSVATTTRFGSSKPVICQEYTEPCTVPQSLAIIAVTRDTATLSWTAPRKNIGQENYFILFSKEPAPQFSLWKRCNCGNVRYFTITELSYMICVAAEHNSGFAYMSKSLRFKTNNTKRLILNIFQIFANRCQL
ncbi:unnamed protein product [Thelazia callipaeda]|uniref:Fibronectin type-III domain-containing protein n=1 Tax=Thelazia callipaeda TaxID=103827 RepID=A0A0N5D686_THECL|nr:unnamed protein product [Thelazia callipaeda]